MASTHSSSELLQEKVIVPVEEVTAFMQRCMEKVGTNPEHARQLAEVLVMGDLRGHFSHGLNRLGWIPELLVLLQFRSTSQN